MNSFGDKSRLINPVASSQSLPAGATSTAFVVPRDNESVLAFPSQRELASVVLANTRLLQQSKLDLHGISLAKLRQEVQAAVLLEAAAYTSSLVGDDIAARPGEPIIVTGHQPELFHPGVWAKNFAAAGLSGKTQGQALNLIVDNDSVTGSRIRVPVGSRAAPSIEWIPFDAAQPQQPWEESTIADSACFQGFGEHVRSRIRQSWNYEPLVSASWPAAVRHSRVSSRICDCLAAARVSVERSLGLNNLEVPMSRVCGTGPFCYFAAFLLAQLPRFQLIYNETIRGYRSTHRLRSITHPVPELESKDGWFEAPFWVWRKGDQRRDRPFARQVGSELELRDSRGVFARLPMTPDRPLDAATSKLAELGPLGIRFRTRALTTTLFARLFLADLFIHGIGGAKYDAMTDQICERFLGIEAPRFATVSATVHLPLANSFPVTEDSVRRTDQRIRELRYNPDRFFPSPVDPANQERIREKSRLIARLTSRHPSRQEHRRLEGINAELLAQLGGIDQSMNRDREQLRHQIRANSILQDREFSWCLQPEGRISSFFRREFLM